MLIACQFSSQLVLVILKQAGRTPPPFPFIFFKPTATIVGPDDRVVILKICQDDQADYEGELVSNGPSCSEAW